MPSTSTPLLLITSAGLAAASVATPTGPYIHITSFAIGSAYGYTPTINQTAIQGNLLYGSVTGSPTTTPPSTYQSIGNNTLNIVCEIPPEAGPWEFGEVALYLDDGSGGVGPLFAIAVFDQPQTKFSSLGTNVVSSYVLNCLLKLQQSTAVFQIDTSNGPPAVLDIFQWSDVYPPGISANPDVPLYLVRELSDRGESTLLLNTSDAAWTLASSSYERYTTAANGTFASTFPVANSSTSWVEVAASLLNPGDLGATNRRWLIQTSDSFFRSVSSVTVSGSNYRFNLNVSNDGTYNNSPLQSAPTIGSGITIYSSNISGRRLFYEQIVNPPSIPLALNGVPGLAYGSSGTYMPGPGIIQAYGMLHSPSTNTGRILTNGDDLNATNWATGVYTTQSGLYGYPANMPTFWDGTIQIENFGSLTQWYKPGSTGGGDSFGNGGVPMFYRSWTGSNWTSWFPLRIQGKQDSGSSLTISVQGQVHIASGQNVTMGGSGTAWVVADGDGNGGTSQQLTINGNLTTFQQKTGGGGFGRRPLLVAAFTVGDTLQFSSSNGQGANLYAAYWAITG